MTINNARIIPGVYVGTLNLIASIPGPSIRTTQENAIQQIFTKSFAHRGIRTHDPDDRS